MPKPTPKPARRADTPRSAPKPRPTAAAAAATDAPSDAPAVTTLHADDREFLGRVMRFLLAIQSPARVARARREGYSPQEHREGWKLWRSAAGQDRPLDHWFDDGHGAAHEPALLDALRQIDAFENTWFPRTRAIIQRVVPREHRDAFERGFFHDLAQQPLGPAVVGSVATFLVRVDGLASSKEQGAAQVRKTLRTRGLTDAVVARMRSQLAALEQPADGAKKSTANERKARAKDVDAANAAQADALDGLHRWFNDWGTTLRSVFDAPTQIELGLVTPHARGRAGAAKGASDASGGAAGAAKGSGDAHGGGEGA